MQCDMTYYDCSVGCCLHHCQEEATEVVWCPTWINAEKGPMNLCARHAQNFKPESNPNIKSGLFFWGKDAWIQYETYVRPLPFTWEVFRSKQQQPRTV